MSSIDSLLNSAAAKANANPSQSPDDPPYMPTTTTYDAADALTTLASLGAGHQYAPAPASAHTHTRDLPSPTPSAPPRRTSFDAPAEPSAPVEPTPPTEHTIHSPTLDHYHHGSRSPEERKRRQSLMTPGESAVLAPIHAHNDANDANDHDHDQDQDPDDALKALELAKSDLGLRTKRTASVAESLASPEPRPAPSKKRSAPSSSTNVKKKGTAKAKPAPKKRRIDDDSRSVTPTRKTAPSKSKKSSHAGTPLESSPAPDDASQTYPSDDDGESSDQNLYCICKKPDNHRWMIGCDGGCDDWFHGDCVNMKQADEGLVDKFICPLCEEAGRGNTTWKAVCRREGCRRPARVVKDRESKYCSDECGVLFMQEQLQRTAGAKDKSKKKKKPDEEEPTPLGGVLRAKDLKALVDASPNIQTFKSLGSGVLTPPQTASPNRSTFNSDLSLTAAEAERLNALHNEKSQLQDRLEVLRDREKFVSMAKEQATRVAERDKLKLKDFCGYDSRLSWSDAEFLLWRNSVHGRAAFQFSTLSPSTEQIASLSADNLPTTPDPLPADTDTTCTKKRCAKHPQWQKLNLQDARFEELEVVEALRECEKEERSVRERARRRGAKDAMARELTAHENGDGKAEGEMQGNGQGEGGDGGRDRNREGWVEVVT